MSSYVGDQVSDWRVPGFELCGNRIDALGPAEAARIIVDLGRVCGRATVHLCNAYTLSISIRDPGFRDLLREGDLNLMDGMPLVWMARRLGLSGCTRRVYGPDLMLDVMERGRGVGLRHFLYGSTPRVLERLTEQLMAKLPGLQIASSESPPFRSLTNAEEDALEQRLRSSKANIIWVGLGTPKQDMFVRRFRDRSPCPLVAVGAAFDFHAGLKRQAPRWLQDRGLEWAFRLATEPRRLAGRYVVGNSVFVLGALRGGKVLPSRRLGPTVTGS